MFTIDLINTILSLWLKPMLMLAVMLSIVKHSYVFSAASSHWFLVCALVCVCIAVPTLLYFPYLSLSVLPSMMTPLTHMTITPENYVNSFAYWLIGIYILGVVWILFFQLASILDIKSLTKQSAHCDDPEVKRCLQELLLAFGIDKHVNVRVSRELDTPVVWGHISPCIILPQRYRAWKTTRLQRVLAHELSHVARHDWLIKMCAKLCCAFMWIVPLAWYVANRLEWYAELSCDDTVINVLDCRSEYAEDLLALSYNQQRPSIALALIQSDMFLRIQHVLDGRNQRLAMPTLHKCLHGVLCILLVLPVSLIYAVPQSEQDMLRDKLEDIRFEYVQDSTPQTPVHRAPLSLPEDHAYIVQIKPESPNFTEEVFVKAEDIAVQVNLINGLSNEEKTLTIASLESIKVPYTEVKGFLPRVMATPRYPSRALSRGIEGQVIIQFDIDEHGETFNPRVVSSQPKKVFDRAVLKALKKFKFTPMEIEGQAVVTRNVTETFIFKVEED